MKYMDISTLTEISLFVLVGFGFQYIILLYGLDIHKITKVSRRQIIQFALAGILLALLSNYIFKSFLNGPLLYIFKSVLNIINPWLMLIMFGATRLFVSIGIFYLLIRYILHLQGKQLIQLLRYYIILVLIISIIGSLLINI